MMSSNSWNATGRRLHSTASQLSADDLLMRRMQALGVDSDAVARAEGALMRDLVTGCGSCGRRDRCRDDLIRGPVACEWRSYCPNAILLGALTEAWWLRVI
jgi:hypothetical protein